MAYFNFGFLFVLYSIIMLNPPYNLRLDSCILWQNDKISVVLWKVFALLYYEELV